MNSGLNSGRKLVMLNPSSSKQVFNYNFSMEDFAETELDAAEALIQLQGLGCSLISPFSSTQWGRKRRRSADVTPPRSPPHVAIPYCSTVKENNSVGVKLDNFTSRPETLLTDNVAVKMEPSVRAGISLSLSLGVSDSISESSIEEYSTATKRRRMIKDLWLKKEDLLSTQQEELKEAIGKVKAYHDNVIVMNKKYKDLSDRKLEKMRTQTLAEEIGDPGASLELTLGPKPINERITTIGSGKVEDKEQHIYLMGHEQLSLISNSGMADGQKMLKSFDYDFTTPLDLERALMMPYSSKKLEE